MHGIMVGIFHRITWAAQCSRSFDKSYRRWEGATLASVTEVQQIEHDRGNPHAELHRRVDPFGEGGARQSAAGGAPALVGAVLGDHRRLRLGQVEYLAGGMVGAGGSLEQLTAAGADGRE
jgi:hypothetical protein